MAKFGTNASGILFSWRDNSSYRLYTLGPLCLWQCFRCNSTSWQPDWVSKRFMISDSVDLYQPFGVLLGVLYRTQPALESSGRRPRKPQLEKKTFENAPRQQFPYIAPSSQPSAQAVLTSLLRAMTLCALSSEINEVDSFKESLLYAPITQLLLLPQGGATASHPLLSLSHPPTISDPPTLNSVSASVSLSCSHSPDLTHFKAKQCCQA